MNCKKNRLCIAVTAALLTVAAPSFVLADGGSSKQIPAVLETPQDMGLAPPSQVRSLTLSLKLVDRDKLEAYIASTTDATSPNYRRFLTPQQFKARYGQPDAVIDRVRSFMAARGITVSKVYANNLLIKITATNAQIANTFGSPIHTFKLSTSAAYQKPAGSTSIPAELSDVVASVVGLSTEAVLTPNHTAVSAKSALRAEANVTPLVPPTPATAATGVPGQYTVADLAAQYNVKPLYARGLTGKGTTLGILTFAVFDPTDVYAYWNSLGLKVDPNRITVVPVNGGTYDDGSTGPEETTLDVEQSGGLAPGASIRVYEAPNTYESEVALFATAVDENLVDTMSISWGGSELANGFLASFDPILLQAAAQGIPVFAASADAGAYDLNRSYPYTTPCTTLLNVDFPASHPYIVAAGGTTLPVVVKRAYADVNVPLERAWAWDFLRDYFVTYYGQAYYYANTFAVGGGGGVSVQYDVPSYQKGLAGVKLSQPAQSLYCAVLGGVPTNYINLPANFAGRNVPDVSLNADPYTGYLLYYKGLFSQNVGGTSFVAPQLNGIFALITEQLGRRVGFPNPQLYGAFKTKGYGAGSPFRPVVAGDNLFYKSERNYNPASGLGVLDVDNLANTLAGK